MFGFSGGAFGLPSLLVAGCSPEKPKVYVYCPGASAPSFIAESKHCDVIELIRFADEVGDVLPYGRK